jgi:hypothetical protein
MSETLTLNPPHYDKLGAVHCGVIRQGTVTCGGDIVQLDDGAEHTFQRTGIKVRRSGNDYAFEKIAD